jgi:class 3 adenylate cyclase
MNDKEILEVLTKSIKEEERKNERKIHLARMSLFSLVLIMMSISRLMLGETLNTRFLLVSLFSISCIFIGLFLWHYYQDPRRSALAKYLLVTLDVAFVFFLLLIVRYTMSREVYETTSDIPAFLLLFMITAMSGLRFDFRLSAYSAVASITVLFGLTIFDSLTHEMSHPYLLVTSFFKGLLLLGVALISGYIGASAKRIVIHDYREQSEKSYIKDLFGRYITPEIRDYILSDSIPLNGERTEATVLIADLRDFTPYVETSDPEEVITSLREYFTAMQRAVREHQGLVLQYVGDEIEAAFGAPVPCDEHADQAVLAALEMSRHLEKLNGNRAKEGKRPFSHRIGIHTGEVLAGNTGSEDQPSYALIGDTVNVAARLQELNKEHGTAIIFSAATRDRMQSSIPVRALETAMLKGISRPIEVFTIDEATPL